MTSPKWWRCRSAAAALHTCGGSTTPRRRRGQRPCPKSSSCVGSKPRMQRLNLEAQGDAQGTNIRRGGCAATWDESHVWNGAGACNDPSTYANINRKWNDSITAALRHIRPLVSKSARRMAARASLWRMGAPGSNSITVSGQRNSPSQQTALPPSPKGGEPVSPVKGARRRQILAALGGHGQQHPVMRAAAFVFESACFLVVAHHVEAGSACGLGSGKARTTTTPPAHPARTSFTPSGQ